MLVQVMAMNWRKNGRVDEFGSKPSRGTGWKRLCWDVQSVPARKWSNDSRQGVPADGEMLCESKMRSQTKGRERRERPHRSIGMGEREREKAGSRETREKERWGWVPLKPSSTAARPCLQQRSSSISGESPHCSGDNRSRSKVGTR